ncbi:PREDICTED: ubiquitin-conjugating enzyme E2 R1 isoform X2 [Colobus angolensis palliatus]|uniref:ubiquitin-conjugating enzyme E2 R1 isoform X2 n=1 Tax=Colobus angolensis palliatus TaxID=336983 RepID=UPI0005F54064|nr:PREDICTED: ubiquitin-conjugating enzyme E2 R1 isoform X2 [Colobus angolensis palliatus]
MARPLVPSSQKALLLELKGLQEEPVEGFRVTLVDEGDLYNWEVAIFGPPNTYYEGGYFKARLKFPIDYPYSPPAFRFLTKMWHPNIYETGDVCISILHPPVDDPQSGELPSERWNPTQNVRTILLSVISLLNEPNTFSPANVDASVMYRKWKETTGALLGTWAGGRACHCQPGRPRCGSEGPGPACQLRGLEPRPSTSGRIHRGRLFSLLWFV